MIVCAHILNVETNKRRKKIFVFIRICFDVFMIKCGLSFMHEKSTDRHHNPARLTTASNHLRGSLRLWRDFTMIGVCSFYPFGVVIWQDVSNMSCKDGMSPLCVAKVLKKLQLPKLLVPHKCDFR